MHILRIRHGFATNSSSTHSIVMIRPGEHIYEDICNAPQFDWECFTLTEKNMKLQYLAQQLRCIGAYDTVAKKFIRRHDEDFLERLLGITVDDTGTIDHQSVLSFPRNFDDTINFDFIKDFAKFLSRDDVMILGGNDNGGDHDLERPSWASKENNFVEYENQRHDAWYDILDQHLYAINYKDYWLLFNPNTGSKYRVSFDQIKPEIRKSIAPELVDLKITDYCDRGCTYCYQGSTTSGKHASFTNIKKIIDRLSESHCLEIAIGGGEPTSHPKFLDILSYAQKKNIFPSFSTRNYQWINNNVPSREMSVYTSAIGYSIESIADLEKLKIDSYYRKKIVPHIVLGTVQDLDGLLRYCAQNSYTPLLLGYKNTGRGSTPSFPYTEETVHKAIALSGLESIGLDTSAVKQIHATQWSDIVEPALYMTDGEGDFSCYMDAVTMTMARSSYCGEKAPLRDNWLQVWESYRYDNWQEIDF